jgi:peroxiredoxin (alkyl hydroperoxide reductase subunit C)
MAEKHQGCVASAKGPKAAAPAAPDPVAPAATGGAKVLARVGKEAPDFEATAFVDGGFKNISLSDYKGKWVVLCFYPGDFTFV